MEGNITWSALAYFFALLVPGAAALFGVWTYIDKQIKAGAELANERINVQAARIDAAEKELGDYKLHVSEKFIKHDALEKMESRLLATEARTLQAIENLTKRIDSLLTEIGQNKPRGRNVGN